MTQRKNGSITADFPGAAYPVASVVKFRGAGRHERSGKVACLRLRHADVVTEDGNEWAVPYSTILMVERRPNVQCSLEEVARMGERLLLLHGRRAEPGAPWSFGFDLATTRAGVCRYRERRIDLAVSYCLAASRAEIEDTILHEIAHAIVGPGHNHDAVWKDQAREIGCRGERCHRVQQSLPKWVGECGCGQQWFRQVLQQRMIGNRVCAKCRGAITWRRNTVAPW